MINLNQLYIFLFYDANVWVNVLEIGGSRMNYIGTHTSYLNLEKEVLKKCWHENKERLKEGIKCYKEDPNGVLGWTDLEALSREETLKRIEEKAEEIRRKADVFIIVGVGGSNQGARAIIHALADDSKPEIIYLGNNLSAATIKKTFEKLKGKSIYAQIIAKNFATIEPGLAFRLLRDYMSKCYSKEELATRLIVTGTEGERLDEMAQEEGYMFLEFPTTVGGRFSVLSNVGLLAMAVSGLSIREVLQGAKDMQGYLDTVACEENPAYQYALIRHYLYGKGKKIEILSYFEPEFMYFGKWWIQLFAESEGKDGKGLFVSQCCYSEDLHSMGQYIQDGPAILFETLLQVKEPIAHMNVPVSEIEDGFNYLDYKDVHEINQAALQATVKAHSEGGIPVCVIQMPALNAYYMGQLFYYFEMACYASAVLLGVNPFDQPGVEAYKTAMFGILKK